MLYKAHAATGLGRISSIDIVVRFGASIVTSPVYDPENVKATIS